MKAILTGAVMALIVLALASPALAQWCRNLPVNDLFNLCPVLDPPPPPPPPAPPPKVPPPPQPQMVWMKPGASNEEFQRTRAGCMLRMWEAENSNPNGVGWVTVFPLCMRAAGWVQVPKGDPQQVRQAPSPKPATRLQVDPN
jgi:hypothetical protein